LSEAARGGGGSGFTPPPLHEGRLDEAGLAALFADLRACARLLSVRGKGGAEQHSGQAGADLDEAERALRDGRWRGVQVRYAYEGAHWCDTVLRDEAGYRVVRLRLEDLGTPPEERVTDG